MLHLHWRFGTVSQKKAPQLNRLSSQFPESERKSSLQMGLPTAEAQRQAEWRAEATQQAAFLQATSAQEPLTPRRTLGPQLPGSKPKVRLLVSAVP